MVREKQPEKVIGIIKSTQDAFVDTQDYSQILNQGVDIGRVYAMLARAENLQLENETPKTTPSEE